MEQQYIQGFLVLFGQNRHRPVELLAYPRAGQGLNFLLVFLHPRHDARRGTSKTCMGHLWMWRIGPCTASRFWLVQGVPRDSRGLSCAFCPARPINVGFAASVQGLGEKHRPKRECRANNGMTKKDSMLCIHVQFVVSCRRTAPKCRDISNSDKQETWQFKPGRFVKCSCPSTSLSPSLPCSPADATIKPLLPLLLRLYAALLACCYYCI